MSKATAARSAPTSSTAGVTRHTLSRVINGQSGISPDMAIRLEKAGWSNADHWLGLQTAYELAREVPCR